MDLLTIWSVLKTLNPIKLLRTELEDLRRRNATLEQDNLELRARVAVRNSDDRARPAVRRHPAGYLFTEGDPIPLCTTCHEHRGREISLKPAELDRGGIRRLCPVCSRCYWDVLPTSDSVVSYYRKSARQIVRELESRHR